MGLRVILVIVVEMRIGFRLIKWRVEWTMIGRINVGLLSLFDCRLFEENFP